MKSFLQQELVFDDLRPARDVEKHHMDFARLKPTDYFVAESLYYLQTCAWKSGAECVCYRLEANLCNGWLGCHDDPRWALYSHVGGGAASALSASTNFVVSSSRGASASLNTILRPLR
ncbi:hypothetical protein N8A90_08090 [Variovorax sp. N23]|nr:hypothetical protein [Variovorax sp. N23]